MDNVIELAENTLSDLVSAIESLPQNLPPKNEIYPYLLGAIDLFTTIHEKDSAFKLRDINPGVVARATKALSSNKWIVHFFTHRFLLHCSYHEYVNRPGSAQAINDFLGLIVQPPITMSQQTRNEIREFCNLVRNKLSKIPYPTGYCVGSRWREMADSLLLLVGEIQDPLHIAVLGVHGSPFYQEVGLLNEIHRESFVAYINRTSETFPVFRTFNESDLKLPGTTIEIDGVHFSAAITQCMTFLYAILTGIDSKKPPHTVVEIGSGYGRLARLFRMATKNKCYILVDFPESLMFAYAFLKANYPDAKTYVVDSLNPLPKDIADQFDFIFCPVQCLEALTVENVSIAINTWSFGEMPQPCVDFLMRCVEKNFNPDYFYLANTLFQDRNVLFESNGASEHAESADIVVPTEPHWWPLQFQLFSTEAAQPHRGSVYRNGGIMVLKRQEDYSQKDLAKQLVDASMSEPHGSVQWMKYAFFAALSTEIPYVIEDFFVGLKRWFSLHGTSQYGGFDFENIGEVKYLRKRLEMILKSPKRSEEKNSETKEERMVFN